MGEDRTITVVVHDAEEGDRADVVLGRRVPGLSRRAARAMALAGHLRVDGRGMSPSTRVRAGQVLELGWTEPDQTEALEVLRVTDAFVYVNKSPRLHTHRLRPSDPPALADAVVAVHPECADASSDQRELGAVHRLDRTTSGVVAFARSPPAWRSARAGLGDGSVEKLYLAVCRPRGRPADPYVEVTKLALPQLDLPLPIRRTDEFALRITAPLGRGSGRGRVRVRPDGLPALTLVWPLHGPPPAQPSGAVVCLLRLCTGRRHQARAHLAHAGLPIVGDPLYGDPGGADRPLLHAVSLDLSACCRGETRVEAALAPDIAAFLASDAL